MIQDTIAAQLNAIIDPAAKELVGQALHEIFLELMIESAKQECEPVKKAAAQEVLASALEAVRGYATHKQRMPFQKPVRAMAAPPIVP
jgi:hypothetical protein